MASMLTGTGGGGPDDTGGFTESIFDMASRLGSSRVGTNNSFAGQNREWGDFASGGLGMGFDSLFGGFGGIGLGGGGGDWVSQGVNAFTGAERTAQGFGGGLGMNARVDQGYDMLGFSGSMGGEAYRGIGGNAYSFRDEGYTDRWGNERAGRNGYGVDGNYTPFGLNNVESTWNNPFGSGGASMENAVFGQQSASGEVGTTDNGGVFASGSYSMPRTELHNVQANSSTMFGDSQAGFDSFGTGKRYTGGVEFDPNGSVTANAAYQGGGWALKGANASHDFGGGNNVSASAGEINTANSWQLDGGWNNEQNKLWGAGKWDTGNTVTDVNLDANANLFGLDANYGASLEEYTDGVHIDGGAHIDANGLSAYGDARWGGMQMKNLGAQQSLGDFYSQRANIGSISTNNEVHGAEANFNFTDGLSASADKIYAGGFRMNDMTAEQSIGNVNTQARLGEVSNDFRLEGAHANLGLTEGSAGFDNLDFGGIRVKDFESSTDFGGLASLDTKMGSFTNGNSFSGGEVNYGANGVDAHLDSMGIMGMDLENVSADFRTADGMGYASGSLGKFHTGLAATDVNAHMGLDGIDLSAGNVNYNQYQLENLNLSAGYEGIYESSLSLGEGHYNQFNADNAYASLNGDGLSLGGENINYSYLGLEDLHASTSIGDGMIGQELHMGSGSLGGVGAGKLDYRTDLFSSDLAVEDLNAHGLKMEDVAFRQNIGDLSYGGSADRLDALNLDVGELEAHTTNFGTTGNARVEDANLDLLNIENGSLGYQWGDTTIAGVNGSYNSSAGVDSASGEWDLWSGTASGEFENARMGSQLSDASIDLFGNNIEIPDMGYNVNASGGGSVDASRGAAQGNLSLAGSSVNFAGHEIELGEWAQASGGVDLSEGAANFNLGGDNGLGADMNLSEGNLDLNLFGTEIDVDEGLRDAGEAIGDAASWVASGVGNLGSAALSLLPSVSLPW